MTGSNASQIFALAAKLVIYQNRINEIVDDNDPDYEVTDHILSDGEHNVTLSIKFTIDDDDEYNDFTHYIQLHQQTQEKINPLMDEYLYSNKSKAPNPPSTTNSEENAR